MDKPSAASRQRLDVPGERVRQTRFPSPLELFLPSGSASVAEVVGAACPARLTPHPRSDAPSGGPVDLLILSFPAPELFNLRAFEDVLDSNLSRAAPGGMVYTLAPRSQRMRVQRLLRQRGLTKTQPIAHLPDWQENRFLLPLQPGLVRFSLSQVMLAPRWKRWAALALLRLPGGQAWLGTLLPWVGIAAFLPGGSPPFHWLKPAGSAAVNASWRENGCSYVLFPLQPGESQPASTVKLSWNAAESEGHEAAVLPALREDASLAGANLPALLEQFDLKGVAVSRYSRVPGAAAAGLLKLSSGRLPEILGLVMEWLRRWNSRTVQRGLPAGQTHLRFLEPLGPLEKQLPEGYRGWLDSLGPVTTAAAAHQDLTMWNVLINERGQLGVIDWEAAELAALPLGDAFYALQDAVSVAHGLSRIQALKECLVPDGRFRGIALSHLAKLSEALSLSPNEIDFCLHACFLHHAANEQQQNPPGAPKPFLELVGWLADTRFSVGRELCP